MPTCDICGAQFAHPVQLGNHIDRMHYNIDGSGDKDSMFTMGEPMDIAFRMMKGEILVVSENVAKKLCPEGKAAAKRKFKVYPSAYANGWAVQYCRGKFRKKGKKK